MSTTQEEFESSLVEVRQARQQAELLRDQLLAEYQRLVQDDELINPDGPDVPQRQQGLEAMRKAIVATERALTSIDQALLDMERVRDEPLKPDI